jgi:galacturan 1,4-alpha-galacturonidase
MKQTICILLSAIAISLGCSAKKQTSTFPDGTPISSWFADTTGVELKDMGKPYIITGK